MMVLSACNNEHRLLPPLPCLGPLSGFMFGPQIGMACMLALCHRTVRRVCSLFPGDREVQRRAIIGHRSDEAKPEGQEPEGGKESRHTTRWSADRTRAAPTMLLTVWKLFLLMLNPSAAC